MPELKPQWIRKKLFNNTKENYVKTVINENNIHTVCQESRCPNQGECFSNKVATFLLLGNICTRNCKFCNIQKTEEKLNLDLTEPKRVSDAISKMNLKYVVLTSVTRDDLADGGASIFVETIKEIKKNTPNVLIEVLTPDFQGNEESIMSVLAEDIVVFNHNLETVEKLYKNVREQANYQRSLKVLEYAKRKSNSSILIKSGIMVGLGETKEEVLKLINDFYSIGGDILTIGQYLQPSKNHYPVVEYVTPETFDYYEKTGKSMGIKEIISGPFVRSSYFAEKYFFKEI
ncbi:MAG: lipoyl synthase [Spirochaetes bacterium GWD1_27_9]|nr:MAG: lipoyl synthase [Spirochaetes bacterium GWB1_27_13]OHD26285.1 MAG: lipoyl synthase [Spirochaetes bacterium GWC1_27_15]OHD32115.1 MAG: lipoyl synthase [Spirochaetes bacterium GWD1_27_9]